jgi:glucose-6-phosphate isomerase
MKLDYVLVIGIGGSYVGVKAGVDFCTQPFDQSKPKIIWVSNISATFLCSLQQMLAKKQFAIIATSRSGTTLEPALAFHLFREQLEKQVGVKSATKLITVITSDTNSNLYKLAKNKKYTIFPIPADVGGRFSTLSPVGMFPMMIKNIDALALIRGASQALKDTKNRLVSSNSAFRYACYRHYFRTKLKLQIENFIVYDPNLVFCGEM